MQYPVMVKWMLKEKRWSKTGKRFETKIENPDELSRMKSFLKSDTKMHLISVEEIFDKVEEI